MHWQRVAAGPGRVVEDWPWRARPASAASPASALGRYKEAGACQCDARPAVRRSCNSGIRASGPRSVWRWARLRWKRVPRGMRSSVAALCRWVYLDFASANWARTAIALAGIGWTSRRFRWTTMRTR